MYYNEKINYVDKKGEFNCQEKVEGYWVKRCVIIYRAFKEILQRIQNRYYSILHYG